MTLDIHRWAQMDTQMSTDKKRIGLDTGISGYRSVGYRDIGISGLKPDNLIFRYPIDRYPDNPIPDCAGDQHV